MVASVSSCPSAAGWSLPPRGSGSQCTAQELGGCARCPGCHPRVRTAWHVLPQASQGRRELAQGWGCCVVEVLWLSSSSSSPCSVCVNPVLVPPFLLSFLLWAWQERRGEGAVLQGHCPCPQGNRLHPVVAQLFRGWAGLGWLRAGEWPGGSISLLKKHPQSFFTLLCPTLPVPSP